MDLLGNSNKAVYDPFHLTQAFQKDINLLKFLESC